MGLRGLNRNAAISDYRRGSTEHESRDLMTDKFLHDHHLADVGSWFLFFLSFNLLVLQLAVGSRPLVQIRVSTSSSAYEQLSQIPVTGRTTKQVGHTFGGSTGLACTFLTLVCG